ncbi:hypothetical protein FRB99_006083 [Tulasnella sp. 403]|nr:hypothetical protein FRB99_006083 [Tulasnella sp. 403]
MFKTILNVAPEHISDVPADDLGHLWTVFTKVKENIKDGRRLENLSWRLWYQEVVAPSFRLQSSHDSPFLDSPPVEQPPLSVDSDTASEPDEANTDVDQPSCPALPPSTSPTSQSRPPARLRPSLSPPTGRRRNASSHPLHCSNPDSASPLNRPPVHDRAHSTPAQSSSHSSRISPRRPPSFNLGKIITSLPQLRPPSLSAAVVAVLPPTTPPSSNQLLAPALVVLQPTPRPTPPDSPRVPNHYQIPSNSTTLLVPQPFSPEPTLAPPQNTPPQTTTAGPGPPPMAPVPVDDGRKKKTFFFKESPGAGEDGAASGSSASSAVKPVPPPQADQITEAVLNGLQNAANSKHARAHLPAKKGNPSTRQLSTLASRQAATRQVTVGHARGALKSALHQRHHSTQVTAATRAPPARSKSTATITTVPAPAPSNPPKRSTSSSKLPPPSEVSSANTIIAPTSPVRPASPAPLPAPAPSPAQTRPKHPVSQLSEKQAEKQPVRPLAHNNGGSKSTLSTKNGRSDMGTSSDFETSDTEGDDSSWASDYSDEDEPETGHITKEAALEAARQRDMFAKVPTRSYADLAKHRQKSGLLTNLFHPDPAIIPYLHHPFRAHSSAVTLGSRPTPPPPGVQSLTSKSTAAMPLAAQVTVTQAQVPANGRPGYRLRGRPEDLDVETSDEEDGEGEDVGSVSKSMAQRRLEELAGMRTKKHEAAKATQAHTQAQAQAQPPNGAQRRGRISQLQTTRMNVTGSEQVLPHHETSVQDLSTSYVHLPPTASAPIVLPHPYNLPAPAPPATPRTTRREMLATEMSESLRRQILWERETNRRLWGAYTRRGATTGDANGRRPPVGVYGNDAFHASGW